MHLLSQDVLLAVASAAIAELARGNIQMQNAIAEAHVINPLVELLRGRKINVQVKGAMAIEALCEKNARIQLSFLSKSVTKFLLKILKVSVRISSVRSFPDLCSSRILVVAIAPWHKCQILYF